MRPQSEPIDPDDVPLAPPVANTRTSEQNEHEDATIRARAGRIAAYRATREQQRLEREELARAEQDGVFNGMLDTFEANEYKLIDFFEFVFGRGKRSSFDHAYHGFFIYPNRVRALFTRFTTSDFPPSTRITVHGWALSVVKKLAGKEGSDISASGILSLDNRTVDENLFLTYSPAGMAANLRQQSPVLHGVLDAFSTTTRQVRTLSDAGKQRKHMVRTVRIGRPEHVVMYADFPFSVTGIGRSEPIESAQL